MKDTVAEIIGAVLVVAGVYSLLGTGWALLAAGVLILLWAELNGFLTRNDQ